jgi:hypothetical protein
MIVMSRIRDKISGSTSVHIVSGGCDQSAAYMSFRISRRRIYASTGARSGRNCARSQKSIAHSMQDKKDTVYGAANLHTPKSKRTPEPLRVICI